MLRLILEKLKRAYKIGRIVLLLALGVVVFLMVQRPAQVAPPQPHARVTENAQRFQNKIADLELAHQRGESVSVSLTAPEVNAALAQANAQLPSASSPGPAQDVPISSTQVSFEDDQVKGLFQTRLYGKDVYVTVAGRLGARNGYVTFQPTQFKVGNMVVPVSLVDPALQRKLAEPENRDKLKLPEFISSLHVEDGELVVSER